MTHAARWAISLDLSDEDDRSKVHVRLNTGSNTLQRAPASSLPRLPEA